MCLFVYQFLNNTKYLNQNDVSVSPQYASISKYKWKATKMETLSFKLSHELPIEPSAYHMAHAQKYVMDK